MIDNPRSPRVRAVAKLAKRSARAETGLFLVEGPQAVDEALAFHPETLVDLFITPSALRPLRRARRAGRGGGGHVEAVSEHVLDAMADTVTPQGVIAVCRQFPVSVETLLAGSPRLLAILEEVRDPGNAGTIIRAADAAGADGVILTGRSVDAYNPKVVRSTTGSIFHLPIAQGIELDDGSGCGAHAPACGSWPPTSRATICPTCATSSRSRPRGCSATRRAGSPTSRSQLADRIVKVPIYGHAESMNLATAASVCLYESAFAQR